MNNSKSLIESDSDNSIIILESPEKNFKRDLSIDELSKEQKKKKLQVSENISHMKILCISNKPRSSRSFQNCEKTMETKHKKNASLCLKEFFSSDPRLDQRLYFNRIDENNDLDIQLYISSILESLLDLICCKKIIYCVEHYYHQMYKRKICEKNNHILQKLNAEYEMVFSNILTVDTKNSDELIIAKRNYEMQIKSQEFICKFLYEDLKTFVNFILETYENKYIIP